MTVRFIFKFEIHSGIFLIKMKNLYQGREVLQGMHTRYKLQHEL